MRVVRRVRTPDPAQGETSDVDDEQVIALGPDSVLARRKRSIVTVAGLQVMVICRRRRCTVLLNRCPHLGADLTGARVCRGTLTCPVHQRRYSIHAGTLKSAPGRTASGGSLTLFPTRVADGWLHMIIGGARGNA